MRRNRIQKVIFCCNLMLLNAMLTGCGFERFLPVLPDQVEDFSLADLEAIQDDERLTDNEKREQIRTAIDAPMTAEGDRLVEFLFTLNVP